MKKNDIALLILIISVSFIVAWFAANTLIGSPKNQSVKVETADKISPNVEPPDKRIFNSDAINPTVERSIGKSADKLPFSSPSD